MQSFTRNFISYFKLTKSIYIGIVSSTGLAVSFAFFYSHLINGDGISAWIGIGFLVYLFALIALPVNLLFRYLRQSFAGETNVTRLIAITHSYVGVIFIFTSIYFTMKVFGDFNDQQHKYIFYADQAAKKINNGREYEPLRPNDTRPFKGMSKPLWSGVANPDRDLLAKLENIDQSEPKICYSCRYWNDFTNGTVDEAPINIIEKIVKESIPYSPGNKIQWYQLFKFQKQNILSNYIDCFYFSVITIATVGYGDISPNVWYTKLFVCLEVFFGLIIFVFAVNLLFVQWNSEQIINEKIFKGP